MPFYNDDLSQKPRDVELKTKNNNKAVCIFLQSRSLDTQTNISDEMHLNASSKKAFNSITKPSSLICRTHPPSRRTLEVKWQFIEDRFELLRPRDFSFDDVTHPCMAAIFAELKTFNLT